MHERKTLNFEFKQTSEGSFEGLLSPYGGPPDGVGDIVDRGAYTKTLKDQGPTRPLLWQHNPDSPIGEITLEDRPDGLWCKGQLLMALPDAAKAFLLMKAGIVKGLSIGFLSVKDTVDGGIRRLKEIKLIEGSVVTFPCAETALITSVKNKQDATLSALIQEAKRAYQWSPQHQSKEGRMISAANKESLKSALDHNESVKTIISALVGDGAGHDDTLEDDENLKRAAISGLISKAKESFRWDQSNSK